MSKLLCPNLLGFFANFRQIKTSKGVLAPLSPASLFVIICETHGTIIVNKDCHCVAQDW